MFWIVVGLLECNNGCEGKMLYHIENGGIARVQNDTMAHRSRESLL